MQTLNGVVLTINSPTHLILMMFILIVKMAVQKRNMFLSKKMI